jgi:hypothetical protein
MGVPVSKIQQRGIRKSHWIEQVQHKSPSGLHVFFDTESTWEEGGSAMQGQIHTFRLGHASVVEFT